MAEKRVTLADVAKDAGVSGTTASLVLTGRGEELRISTAVQARVRDAATRLKYRPNAVSVGLRKGTTRTLGFISDNVATSQLAGTMIKGALESARQHGFMLFIAETEGDPIAERGLIHAMMDRQVDGIVLATMFTREHRPPGMLDHIPSVLLNSIANAPTTIDAVIPDELAAGRAAAQFLLDKGHTKIHVLGAGPRPDDIPPDSIAGRERLLGIQAALDEAHLTAASYHVLPDWQPAFGREAMRAVLASDGDPDSLICLNDRVALGALQVLEEAGLQVPTDVSIVSFDNHVIAQWMIPGLTTFEIPHHDMGAKAVDLLVERIRAGESEPHTGTIIRVPLTLHVRDSVAERR